MKFYPELSSEVGTRKNVSKCIFDRSVLPVMLPTELLIL